MKRNSILWAVLPMMAAALMTTACSNEENAIESLTQQSAEKTIPYTVTVGQDEAASTRATVDSDLKTLKFATGDKLYVTGTNISGVLSIQTGTGTASATFSGDLTYTGAAPTASTSLTATLVSAQQTDGAEVTINPTTKAVTVNYPTTAYCADVATAVQKYSRLTGTSTYGAKSFSLTQQTAFLNFEITFSEGTATGTTLSAVVYNNGPAISTANVTTVTDGGVKAKFVLPVDKITLKNAVVKLGDKPALAITDATLTGKVYNVKRTQGNSLKLSEVTSDHVGWRIGSKGTVYHPIAGTLPSGETAVAVIAYVGAAGSADASSTVYKGLALALNNASESDVKWCSQYTANCLTTQYYGASDSDPNDDMAGIANTNALVVTGSHNHDAALAARSYNGGTYPTGTSAWFLPSAGQWARMWAAGYSYLSGAGLTDTGYWSSTECNVAHAWRFIFNSTSKSSCTFTHDIPSHTDNKQSFPNPVRACIAF
jgi:hypothetical protein